MYSPNGYNGTTKVILYSAAKLVCQYQVSLYFSVCLTLLGQLLFSTRQARILIEGINFAALTDVLTLIVFLAKLDELISDFLRH